MKGFLVMSSVRQTLLVITSEMQGTRRFQVCESLKSGVLPIYMTLYEVQNQKIRKKAPKLEVIIESKGNHIVGAPGEKRDDRFPLRLSYIDRYIIKN